MHERLKRVIGAEGQNTAGVHFSDGQWFMRLDQASRGVQIPEQVARTIKISLWAESRKTTYRGGFNAKVRARHLNINCHQAALYAAGLIDTNDVSPKTEYGFSLFSESEFRKCAFDSYADFKSRVRTVLGNDAGLLQFGCHGGGYLYHSSIVGIDEQDRGVCFEKVGFEEQFRIALLSNTYKKYRYSDTAENEWALNRLESVQARWEREDMSSIFGKRHMKNTRGYFTGNARKAI